jgi:CheY-like chemotaxis protein
VGLAFVALPTQVGERWAEEIYSAYAPSLSHRSGCCKDVARTIVCDHGLPDQKDSSMLHKIIMLVEDNPDDEVLALRALRKNNIQNEVVTARDGVEALDYLFGTGADAERDMRSKPVVILLDLKLPKDDGLEVLRRLRTDERTQFIPVVLLTSSKGEQDLINS